jgi:hypothetical protein
MPLGIDASAGRRNQYRVTIAPIIPTTRREAFDGPEGPSSLNSTASARSPPIAFDGRCKRRARVIVLKTNLFCGADDFRAILEHHRFWRTFPANRLLPMGTDSDRVRQSSVAGHAKPLLRGRSHDAHVAKLGHHG